MAPDAVTERRRAASRRSDLAAARRLATKVDMSAAGITRRLGVQSALREACLRWARRPSGGTPGKTSGRAT
jgi:hypothetical protein